VGKTETSEGGLRVVMATGARVAASEQELPSGPLKPTLLPPWLSQWLASGVSGWIRRTSPWQTADCDIVLSQQ